jgi:hypothetical protein
METKDSAEKAVREIRRKTRRRFTAEEKIRIVIEGLRTGESDQETSGVIDNLEPAGVDGTLERPLNPLPPVIGEITEE